MGAMINRALVIGLGLIALVTITVAQGRQGRGQREPESPAPTIREYKPQSTLVVSAHPVPRAKFPAVDMHGHPPPLTSPEAVQSVVRAMDSLNLRIMVVTGNPGRIPRDQMLQDLEVLRTSPHRDRFAVFANIDFRNVGPGFGQKAAAQLEEDIKAGAVGLGEIMKDFGLTARKADGSRLALDDPELDPIWQTAGRLNIPVMMHVGDPAPFWQPFDYSNERWLEMALFPNRRCPPDRCPPFEALIGQNTNLEIEVAWLPTTGARRAFAAKANSTPRPGPGRNLHLDLAAILVQPARGTMIGLRQGNLNLLFEVLPLARPVDIVKAAKAAPLADCNPGSGPNVTLFNRAVSGVQAGFVA